MHEPRHPGQVPDEPTPEALLGTGLDGTVLDGTGLDIDTDGDGRPDTAVTGDGVDLVLLTDLDGDSLADQVLRIGPDGVVRQAGPAAGPGSGVLDGLLGGAAAGVDV